MPYTIQFLPAAVKELKSLPRKAIKEIDAGLLRLTEDPHKHSSVKPLRGFKNIFRLRVGDYRIIYKLERGRLIVLVIRIGHRKDVYRVLDEKLKSVQ